MKLKVNGKEYVSETCPCGAKGVFFGDLEIGRDGTFSKPGGKCAGCGREIALVERAPEAKPQEPETNTHTKGETP